MNDIKVVFDFWNSLHIINHRDITRFKGTISARLKLYTVEELKEAMNNYHTIVMSPDYYFTYKWGLKEWLLRGLDSFMTENAPHDRYKKKYGSPYAVESKIYDRQVEWGKASEPDRIKLEGKWRNELKEGNGK